MALKGQSKTKGQTIVRDGKWYLHERGATTTKEVYVMAKEWIRYKYTQRTVILSSKKATPGRILKAIFGWLRHIWHLLIGV